MVSIKEVPTKTRRFERIGSHTHIRGLGLDEDLKAVKIKENALEKLTEIGAKSSLRYSVQLLSLAAQNAGSTKHNFVTVKDVERVNGLFMDVGEAAEHLRKYEKKLMYH